MSGGADWEGYNTCPTMTPFRPLLLLLALPLLHGWRVGGGYPASAILLRRGCDQPLWVMAADSDSIRRRPSRIGQVVQGEIADIIRTSHSLGSTRIPSGLQQLISVVDVDMSPDLRNANVKVSIIGDRKDKVSAVRWLKGNVRGLRHELAKRNRHMKRIPILSFQHVDVGAATDMMIKLQKLRSEDEEAAIARGDGLDEDDAGIDFKARDEDAWLEDDEDDGDDDWLADEEEEDSVEGIDP